MRKRCRLRKKLDSSNCDDQNCGYQQKIRDIEKCICESHRDEQKQDELRAVNCIKNNANYFFRYAKRYSKRKDHIGPLRNENDELTNDIPEMCNLLLEQYNSVFSLPCAEKTIKNPQDYFVSDKINSCENETLSDILLNKDVISEAINEMSTNSAAGPDGMPASLFKECRDELCIPLQIFFAKSLTEGIIPSCLKTAAIVPVYKGGGPSSPSNYRPISLTPILMKIFERVVRKQVITFMTKRDKFNPSQHGFREGRSCLSALLMVYDNIMTTLNSSVSIDMIYLDFAKAFDKVDHNILLHKVKALGIQGKLGTWIHSFLSNRTHHVRLPGGRSTCSEVLSGVPQGTVLGPVLFLILMSDITEGINCNIVALVTSFADDTKVFATINNPSDCDDLQSDLDNIYSWSSANNMMFNQEKFQYIRYHMGDSSKINNIYLSPDHNILPKSGEVKDLGILMSENCDFDSHIASVAKKCSRLCGWILRTFSTRSKSVSLTLFKSIVLPYLDYGSQLWSPYKIKSINALEKVQRVFTKHIDGMHDLSYTERLKALQIYSLQRRRDRYMAIYIWKILEGNVPNFSPPIKCHISARRGRLCNSGVVPTGHLGTLCHNSFRSKAATIFNCLPKHIRDLVNCANTSIFKRALDYHLCSIEDSPMVPNECNSLTSRSKENAINKKWRAAIADQAE